MNRTLALIIRMLAELEGFYAPVARRNRSRA